MVAGSGEATASSAGTPSSDSTGVATEDPPTPKMPMSKPMAPPATMMTGHGATTNHHTRLTPQAPASDRPTRRISPGPDHLPLPHLDAQVSHLWQTSPSTELVVTPSKCLGRAEVSDPRLDPYSREAKGSCRRL